jgi:hypothetical protein
MYDDYWEYQRILTSFRIRKSVKIRKSVAKSVVVIHPYHS